MPDTVITADHIRVVRGGRPALDDVSFKIAPGKVIGLIGPSGSGKTTLMRTIIGTQAITAGTLTVLGMAAGSKALRERVGYVAQVPAVYDDLTAVQNLRYFAAMAGVPDAEGAVRRVLGAVDLNDRATQLVLSMSGGERARVNLAVALLSDASLLVLDEPTVGLDPVLRRSLWELFRSLADEGRSLLISSHVMDEAEQCPDLLLLRDGAVLYHSSKQELLRHTRTRTVEEAFLQLAGGPR